VRAFQECSSVISGPSAGSQFTPCRIRIARGTNGSSLRPVERLSSHKCKVYFTP